MGRLQELLSELTNRNPKFKSVVLADQLQSLLKARPIDDDNFFTDQRREEGKGSTSEREKALNVMVEQKIILKTSWVDR